MFNLPPSGARRGDPASPLPEVPNHAAPVPTCHSRRRRMPGVSHPTSDGEPSVQQPSAPSAIHARTAPRDSSKENYTPTELDSHGLEKLHRSSSVRSVPEAQRLTSPKKLDAVDLPRPRCSSLESNSRRPQSRSSATSSTSRTPTKRDSSVTKGAIHSTPTTKVNTTPTASSGVSTPTKATTKVVSSKAAVTTPSSKVSLRTTSPGASNVPSNWTVTTARTGPTKAHTPVRRNPTDTFESKSTPVSRPKGPTSASSTATHNHPTAAPMKDAHGRRRPAPQFPPHHEDVSVGGVGPATPMKVATTDEPSPSPEAAQKPKAKAAVVVPMVSPLESVGREPTPPPVKAPPTPTPTTPTVVSPLAVATRKSVPLVESSGPQSAVAVGEAQKLPTRKGGGCTVGSLTGQSQRRNTSLDTVLNYRHSEEGSPSSAASNARSSPSPAWPKTLPHGKNNPTTAAHHQQLHHKPHTSGHASNTSTSSIHVLVDPSNMEGAPAQGLPRLQRSSMVPARTVPVVEPSKVHQPSQPSRETSEKRRAPSSSSAHRGDDPQEDRDTSQLPVFSQIELDEGKFEGSSDEEEGTILRESF